VSPDETLRAAARLLRQGAPVEVFVGALDDGAKTALHVATQPANKPAPPPPAARPACIRGCGQRGQALNGAGPPCCCGSCWGITTQEQGHPLVGHCDDCPHRVRP
jgi:hypothetical protein